MWTPRTLAYHLRGLFGDGEEVWTVRTGESAKVLSTCLPGVSGTLDLKSRLNNHESGTWHLVGNRRDSEEKGNHLVHIVRGLTFHQPVSLLQYLLCVLSRFKLLCQKHHLHLRV